MNAAYIHAHSMPGQDLTQTATHRLARLRRTGDYRPLGHCTDQRAIVILPHRADASSWATIHAAMDLTLI